MPFKSLTTVSDLPPEGPLSDEAREKHDLDFKSFADKASPWEHAKDIAAFANALGGTILVGSSDKPQVAHHGLKSQTSHEVRNIYEGAALMCSPPVPIDVVPINFPDGRVVVAVNVPPFPEAMVGAPEYTKDKNGRAIVSEHGWRFPVRQASQTDHVQPKELALYMNSDARRAYVRLHAIPKEQRAHVQVEYVVVVLAGRGDRVRSPGSTTLRLEPSAVQDNSFKLIYSDGDGDVSCRVPLCDVIDVWRCDDERWAVRVKGTLTVPGPSRTRALIYTFLP